jgi:outer membrane protein TolC
LKRLLFILLLASIAQAEPLTLAKAIDIALTNNPRTRTTYLQARAAEAALGSAKSAYLPEIDINATAGRVRNATQATNSFSPSVALSYLLFDFGGREAEVEQARQTLAAANLFHDQAMQDVILATEQTYYSYLDAKALLAAQEATVRERRTSLDAAEARHNAGVATIADVLQARTAFSQSELDRESIEGQLRTIEGTFATVLGSPVTTRYEFGDLPLDVPAQSVTSQVEELITRATSGRPDLAATRAEAERAGARVREVRSAYLPSVVVNSNAGRTIASGGRSFTPYAAVVAMNFPVFTGFRNRYDIREAQIEADLAKENVRSLEQQVGLQVWTSYYSLQTATQRLTTAKDLLNSAQQSADVARDRYKAGVGNILDVLTAQSALESARAQEVQARADWFLSVAQLAHDTGTLTQEEIKK